MSVKTGDSDFYYSNKKIIILICIIVTFAIVATIIYIKECPEKPIKEVQEIKITDEKTDDNPFYKTVVIDSCEYIVYEVIGHFSGVGGICHKGNCKYCEQRKLKQ